MKAPSKNIMASLRGQSPGGREAGTISVSKQTRASMSPIPGEAGVESPPGMVNDRSAQCFADAMTKIVGNG
jgi:hypothetical protein